MAFELKETLDSRLSKLEMIVKTIGMIQVEIVDALTKDNPGLQGKIVAAMLSIEENRSNFTEWLVQQDNVPDDVMTFMMEVNEEIDDMRKDTEDE